MTPKEFGLWPTKFGRKEIHQCERDIGQRVHKWWLANDEANPNESPQIRKEGVDEKPKGWWEGENKVGERPTT